MGKTQNTKKCISSLKEARKAAGMTQEELGNLVYVTRNHISSIECNRILPSLPTARAICNALNCSWDIFFDDDSNTDEKVQKAFETYMNFENDLSAKTSIAEAETKQIEQEFLEKIGNEHKMQLDELISNVMCIWLEHGFAAGYTAK